MDVGNAHWGSVPEWVAAVGTVGAFGIALWPLRKQLGTYRAAERDRIESGARKIAAWHRLEPDGDRATIHLKNAGENLDFAAMPENVLRPLFEACRVEVKFNKLTNEAVCTVSLDEDTVGLVNAASDDGHAPRDGDWPRHSGPSCTDVFGAPGEARPRRERDDLRKCSVRWW